MELKDKFESSSFSIKMILLLALVIVSGSLVVFFYDSIFRLLGFNTQSDMAAYLKGVQFFQSFGLFILPSLAAAYLFSPAVSKYLYLNRTIPFKALLLTILIMVVGMPFLNLVVQWNESLHLPAFMSGVEEWMKDMEQKAKETTDFLLQINSSADLWVNIIVVAVLAGIGEELLFRGVIQRLLFDKSRNVHIAVWGTALIFSAIHLQFYGFLPRTLLGAFFGYLLVWTGNLYIPIIAHFFNNFVGIMADYFDQKGIIESEKLESVGTFTGDTVWYAAVSFVLVVALIVYVRKEYNSSSTYINQISSDEK